MVNNEKTNNSTETQESSEVKTNAEKISIGAKATSTNEDIVKLARRQKAEHDQERAEWEVKDKQRAKEELEMLRENTHLKKELGDIKKEIEAIKYKSTLDREMDLAKKESGETGQEVKLTPDQKIHQIFMNVIKARKERALKKKAEKKDNVYYM